MNTDPSEQILNYQNGLLHFAYLLVSVDGVVKECEKIALNDLCREEEIPTRMFEKFILSVGDKKEYEIYEAGLEFLNQCSEDEKISAIVHLFRLSEVDDQIHKKEVKLLFYSLQVMGVDFEDVELSARMAAVKRG